MSEFTTVSVQEAQLRTIPGRQGKFINEYADYIQQLPKGQAGKLTIGEGEKHTAIRRRLVTTAKAMHIPLIVKRSGNDLYFWREDRGDEQPRSKRRYTRRARSKEETPGARHASESEILQERHSAVIEHDQSVDELGMVEQGIPDEESPELGQTPV
jgi:hypothetical protein